MQEQKDLEKFIRENKPPFTVGSPLYWIDEIGNIKISSNAVRAIILDEDWKWKYLNDNNDICYVAPGVKSKFNDFLSKEDAEEFKKTVKIKYAIFKKSKEGNLFEKSRNYGYYKFDKNGILYGKDVTKKNYVEELISKYSLKNSFIILQNIEGSNWYKTQIKIDERGSYNTDIFASLEPLNKYGTRELEDMFDGLEY